MVLAMLLAMLLVNASDYISGYASDHAPTMLLIMLFFRHTFGHTSDHAPSHAFNHAPGLAILQQTDDPWTLFSRVWLHLALRLPRIILIGDAGLSKTSGWQLPHYRLRLASSSAFRRGSPTRVSTVL